MTKFASAQTNPRTITKEGMVVQYAPSGEYTIRLGNRADVIVKGIAKQESDLNKTLKNVLSYLGTLSPKVAEDIKQQKTASRDIMIYTNIDKCRDCAFYENDTSHETYMDKCKNCTRATLGGCEDRFFPKSYQISVFSPGWALSGGSTMEQAKKEKKAFQGTMSLLDAHVKGSQGDRSGEGIAFDIIASVQEPNPVNYGTALFKYFKDSHLNFQRYGREVVAAIEKHAGIDIHLVSGDNVIFAVETEKAQKCVSDEIKALKEKGKTQDQAVGAAMGICKKEFPSIPKKADSKGLSPEQEKSLREKLKKQFEEKHPEPWNQARWRSQEQEDWHDNWGDRIQKMVDDEINKIKQGKKQASLGKKADSNIYIHNMTVDNGSTVKLREHPEVPEGGEVTQSRRPVAEPMKEEKKSFKEAAMEGQDVDTAFKKYDRVHLKSDPSVKGTYMEVQDSKPGDIDDLVVFDEAFEGTHIIETTPMELEGEGVQADAEQQAFADEQFAAYEGEHKEYEADFEEKVEGISEGKDIAEKEEGQEKAASKKKEDTSRGMPGEMVEHRQKELDEYEKEPKDNYTKSRQLKPQAKFQGSLCLAEVK